MVFLLILLITTSNKAKLKTLKGEEYHFDDEIILSHLGRSTKRNFLTDKYCINWKKLTHQIG